MFEERGAEKVEGNGAEWGHLTWSCSLKRQHLNDKLFYICSQHRNGRTHDLLIDNWVLKLGREEAPVESNSWPKLGHLPLRAVWIAIAALHLSIFPFPRKLYHLSRVTIFVYIFIEFLSLLGACRYERNTLNPTLARFNVAIFWHVCFCLLSLRCCESKKNLRKVLLNFLHMFCKILYA